VRKNFLIPLIFSSGSWYLALAYLAIEDFEQCDEALDSIITKGDASMLKKARKLRRKVQKISIQP